MKTYTIEELQELSDADLNALAAELRGRSLQSTEPILGVRPDVQLLQEGEYQFLKRVDFNTWNPATDRNQSGELLEWFVETQWKGHYAIRSGKLFRSIHVTAETLGDDVEVGVNDTGAKAETVAFCAAMLAIQNARGGASE